VGGLVRVNFRLSGVKFPLYPSGRQRVRQKDKGIFLLILNTQEEFIQFFKSWIRLILFQFLKYDGIGLRGRGISLVGFFHDPLDHGTAIINITVTFIYRLSQIDIRRFSHIGVRRKSHDAAVVRAVNYYLDIAVHRVSNSGGVCWGIDGCGGAMDVTDAYVRVFPVNVQGKGIFPGLSSAY